MFKVICVGAMGIGLMLGASSAMAQSLADPPPLIDGVTSSKIIYTTTGVFDSANSATIVTCSSTQKTGGPDVIFAVEFYNNGGLVNDVTTGNGTSSMTPDDTDIIATRAVTNISAIALNSAPNIAGLGSARVLANSTKLICAAFIVDVATGDYQSTLPMFKAVKQSGD